MVTGLPAIKLRIILLPFARLLVSIPFNAELFYVYKAHGNRLPLSIGTRRTP